MASRTEGTRRVRDYAIAVGVVAIASLLALATLETNLESPVAAGPYSGPAPIAALVGATGRIYARPLTIQPGSGLDEKAVLRELARRGYSEIEDAAALEPGRFVRGPLRLALARRGFEGPRGFEPAGRFELRFDRRGRLTRISDGRAPSTGLELEPEPIGWLDSQIIAARAPVRLDELPTLLIDALLAVEDRRFYDHVGIDPWRIGGALLANLRAGRYAEGASTITQQLARSLHLGNERTLPRKLREVWLALSLERRLTKEQILEAYLNEIYLGQDSGRSLRGVRSASQHYFAKPTGELALHEIALLVGLIQAPTLYSPYRNPENARGRRDVVLTLLHEQGVVSEAQALAAASEPLGVREPSRLASAGWWNDRVREQLVELLDGQDLPAGAITLHTTLDSRLQRIAARALREGLAELEADYPRLARADPPLEAALVALDPRTGELLAQIGGRSYTRSSFDRSTQALRQPGSLFKPIVALTALVWEGPAPSHTLASQVFDEPLELPTEEGVWAPRNHDDEFRGPVTLRHAVEQSLNVPMARFGLDVGARRIVRTARRLGIRSRLRAVPSLALGTSEVSLLEMTTAYGVLAARGLRAAPQRLAAVRLEDPRGETQNGSSALPLPANPPVQVFDPGEVFLVTSALRGVIEVGTGRRVRSLGVRVPVAGKTGSTNDYRDAWFVGYTPDLAVGVWVGFDDATPVGLQGSAAAIPIFARFLREARPDEGAHFTVPSDVDEVEIDLQSGARAGVLCPGVPEWFLRGTAPTHRCVRDDWLSRFGRTILRDRRQR